MATYTQLGSITIDAFQWNGPPLVISNLPIWARKLPLLISGGTDLCVPTTGRTVLAAHVTDWVFQAPDGSIHVVSNAYFVSLYH
jgi:hypothetical protein